MKLCFSPFQLSRGSFFFSTQFYFFFILPVMALVLLVPTPAAAQVMITRQDVKHDVSPALRDMAKTAPAVAATQQEAEPLRLIPLPAGLKPPDTPDSVLQRTTALAPTAAAPAIINNFDGIGQGVFGTTVHVAPPDTNGAVGLTQYVQWVNASFAVFDKTTTSVILGPVAGNTPWVGFGGACETTNDGDPVITYDKLADRWVFSQFSVENVNGPFFQCVAVSTTSDATGPYNRYAFSYSNFDDYPKMGVWPDAYYVTFNMFGPNSFVGADACAYDRNAMLNGLAATQICFQQGASVGSLLPSDLDGHTLPPAGSPNYMMTFGANALELYKFHVDFVTPANSTFTGPTEIPVAPFTPLCNGGNCVPQSGDPTVLDSLGDRLMYRLAYRNFGDHESLVVNHSVAPDATTSGGVRWYEIQNPGGTPSVAQQSTFAPDSNFRWMGSIAMDGAGDIALGYSVSSSTMFPSIAFAGRAAADPVSTLGAETTIVSGTGAQTSVHRWGDYSAMQVDPSDDCTFWYTTEYLKTNGSFNWNTRIANFKFPGCGAADLSIAKTHTGNFTQGQTGATYTITVTNEGGKDTTGTVTVTDVLPAKLTAKSASGTGWTCTAAATTTCTRTDALAAGASYPPITLTVDVASDAPGSITNTATVSGGGETNTGNDSATDTATVIQQSPDLAIAKTHSGSFIQGQTGTYTIAVSNVGLSPTDGTAVTVTDALPAGLTVSTVAGSGWTCLAGPPVTCSRSDVLASNSSYPAIALTVNIAATTAASVVNTATVSGGGNVNPLNDTANDPTRVIPPPPDLTITKSHTGNFNQGQINGASYTLNVQNIGTGPTTGLVTVADTLPAGLSIAFMSGTGWACNFTTVTCTRGDALPVNGSYPPITVTVTVANNAPASVINTATVSGGGEINTANDTATDPTTINPAPDLTITSSHTPEPFIVGQTGTYTLTVSNVGQGPTSGPVNVNDFLPQGLSVTAVTATGWNCNPAVGSFVSCSRSDALAGGGSYPAIVITVSVNGGGPVATNTPFVNGGGEFNTTNDTASDITHITAPVLAITKTHVGNFTVGQPGAYTISVSNTGVIATVGIVSVNDFLPTGLTASAVSATGWNCSTLPTTFLTCSRSDALAPNASYPPINLTVNVGDSFPNVTNTATVTGGGDSNFRSASDPTIINTPSLAITKTHTGNFTVGQTGTYTITVSNTALTATAGTVTITDFMPFGLTAVAAGGTGWGCGTLPATVLNCTRFDSLAGKSSYPPLTVVAQVNGGGPSVINTANVSGGGDANLHSASDPTNINAPILAITKSHTGNFTAGQSGTYTITVSNTGTIATSGTVTVIDSIPANMTATAVTGAGWTCPLQTTFLSCTRSDALAPGSSYPVITLTVTVAGGAPSVINSASVSGGGDPNFHVGSDPTTIITPTLAISKTHTGNFTIGQPGTYTLTVSNTGTAPTSGLVTVTDSLPSGMSATATSGTGWNCSGTAIVTCSRSDALAQAASYPPITLTVSVGAGGQTFNVANVTGGGDSIIHSAFDLTIITGPVLSLAKTHVGDFTVGQTGTYTLTVSNTGTVGTVGLVTVSDFVPPGMTAATVGGTGWTCALPPSVNCTRSDALAPASSYPPITLTVNVNGGGPSVTNTANVSGGGDSSFHSASDLTNIIAPVLAISKSHVGNFTTGQTGTYTITVSNTGAVATTGTVSVTDFLPQGMSTSTVSGTGWGCSGSSQVLCTRSDALAPAASYPPITLTVNVGNSLPTVVNTATVTGGGDSQTHSANDPTTVGTPTLSITKTHAGNFAVGQPGVYTIIVGNVGTIATNGTVTVTDILPFIMSATAIDAPGWGCSTLLPTSFVTCTRSDSLAAGSNYPAINMTVSVSGGTSSVTNSATVIGGGDGLLRTAVDQTNILTPVLTLSGTHTGNFNAGQTGSYTITVSNGGSLPGGGFVTVNDALPAGLTATAVDATGWSCFPVPSTNISCQRSDALAAGASYPSIVLTVAVDPNIGPEVVNRISMTGGGDPNAHTATDLTTINLPDLAISASHTGNFFTGESGANYTFTVSNVGSVATGGGVLLVTSNMPPGLTAASAAGAGWLCSILAGPQTEMDCTRPAGTLLPGSSYPPISLTVNVANNAPPNIINSVSVFGVGDANFANNIASDNAAVSLLALLPGSATSVSVVPGSPGAFAFTANLSAGASVGTVTLSATGLPPNSTVSFNPATLIQTGPVTMTVNTSGNGHTASLIPDTFDRWFVYSAALVCFFGLLLLNIASQQARRRLRVATCVYGFAVLLLMAGCGGGGGSSTTGTTPNTTPGATTPAGTYIIVVTATSSTPGVAPVSTPVTLVVQ